MGVFWEDPVGWEIVKTSKVNILVLILHNHWHQNVKGRVIIYKWK